LIHFLALFYRVNVCLFQQWKAILRQEKGGLSLITNIFKATIITAASNTRKPRVAIAWAILNAPGHASPETKI
jgi:hypothetical protein